MADNYYGITDVGKRRDNNEDAFIAQTVMHEKFIAACVIDGLGGYEGGEVAAQLAKDAVAKQLEHETENPRALLKQAIIAAHEAIVAEKKSGDNKQMACVLTLTLADLTHNKLYYAHVGDTRLYLLRDNSLVKLTHDHSFVGMLVDSGRISEEAGMNHPNRHEINRAVGFGSFNAEEDYIETGESPFLPGDILLVCSDGLSDMLDTATMVNILTSDRKLSVKGKALIDTANDAGGKDNITAVLVHNDNASKRYEPTMPAAKKADDAGKLAKVVKKGRSSILPLLVFLCLLLLAAVAWLLYQEYRNQKLHEAEANAQFVVHKHNEREQQLADSIDKAAIHEVFVVNAPDAEPIPLTDSIIINKDTLHVIGNGAVIKCDTTYKGPAFILSSSCKYILLDSITFENFDVGVAIKNPALHLKNVQFKNCRVPVQYNLLFNYRPIVNGRFADTVFHDASFPR